MRSPSPLPTGARIVIAACAAVLVIAGIVLVHQAGADDRGTFPGQAWRSDLRPPRAARVDVFDGTGSPGSVAGFGTWNASGPGWTVAEGMLTSTANGASSLQVVTDTDQVLVYAQVVTGTPGGGVAIGPGAAAGGVGLRVVVDGAGTGWQLERFDATSQSVLATFDKPTTHVAVQLTHLGSTATVTFDGSQQTVDLPGTDQVGRSAGVVSASPGTAFDLVGYLPLAEG